MRSLPAIFALLWTAALLCLSAAAQEEAPLVVKSLGDVVAGLAHGDVHYNPATHMEFCTNGVYVQRGNVVVMADSAWVNTTNGQVEADGRVRIETGDELWVGEHARYNLKTHLLQTGQFRTGRTPVFAEGEGLTGVWDPKAAGHHPNPPTAAGGGPPASEQSTNVLVARDAYVTGDDYSDPTVIVRASQIRICPGQSVEMWNAVVWADGVPVFYFPYYKRNLGKDANNWNFLPGYRSVYGGYLLNTYTWFLNDEVDGKLHFDYRSERGAGLGPDLNLHLDRWGDAAIRYYYLHDTHPYTQTNGLPDMGIIPQNRQRFYLGYQATPVTNLNVKAVLDYQSDPLVAHDFFETAYRDNPQPYSYLDVNPYWENWSLDAEAKPELNNFFDQVDRLPDVQLNGFRQEIAETPFYYDSKSSVGYYRRNFVSTNGLNPNLSGGLADYPPGGTNYSAGRADTYQQITLPWTFFNWLNVAPRAGERLTYYGGESGQGGITTATTRSVFNTGMSTSFKATHLWPDATNSFLQVDGLRHVIAPSVDYVYVPRPSATPNQLPQFDYDLPSLLLLPIDSVDYNNIDSVDSQNVLRFGVRNTFQTKRDGQMENLFDWDLMLDWNLNPNRATNAPNLGAPGPQKTFDDLYSHFTFRPRTWLMLESQVREDINDSRLNLAYHQVSFVPNEKWSWGIGDLYLANGFPASTEPGANLLTSTYFYRLDDNWGFRMTHYFEPASGHLQEQFYTIYRDFRSWTGALTFRAQDDGLGHEDYAVAFSFSLKFAPNKRVDDDTVHQYNLLGY